MVKIQPDNSKVLVDYYTANVDPSLKKLFSFTALPPGWHYGQGQPVTWPVISKSIAAICALRALGARVIEVFPSIDGAVLISAYAEDRCIDVTVSKSHLASFVVERDDVEVASGDSVALADLWQKIEKERWLACTSSDSSILGTTVTRNVGLFHWRSTTLTEREYQWCANAA